MNWKVVLTKKLGSKLIFTNILMRSVKETHVYVFKIILCKTI